MSKKIQTNLTKSEFISLMLNHTHKHFASITATTLLDNKQMKGGKKTAEKYGGYVVKTAKITFSHAVDYEKAVKAKLEKYDLNPEKFVAEEHPFAKRALCGGKLTSLSYHKDDESLAIDDRRWYLVVYVMDGCVKSDYSYIDANGNDIAPEVIHADLYDKTSRKQADAGLTDISQQVIYRNYKVDSLDIVNFEKNEITII